MSGREEIPNELAGSPRDETGSPLDLERMLPGAPLDFSPPGRPYPTERIDGNLTDIETTVDEFAGRMVDSLAAELQPVLDVATELQSALEGEVENALQPIEATATVLADKSFERVVNRLDQIYSIVIPLGYEPPAPNEAIVDNEFPPKPGPPPPPEIDIGKPPVQPPLPEPSTCPNPPVLVRDYRGCLVAKGCRCKKLGEGLSQGVNLIGGTWHGPHGGSVDTYGQLGIGPPGEPIHVWRVRESGEPCGDYSTYELISCDMGMSLAPFVPLSSLIPGMCRFNAPKGWSLSVTSDGYIAASAEPHPTFTPLPATAYQWVEDYSAGICGPVEPQPPVQPPQPPQPPAGQCPAPEADVCGIGEIAPVADKPPAKPDEEYCASLQSGLETGLFGDKDFAKLIHFSSGNDDGGTISNAIRRAITGSKLPIVPRIVNAVGDWINKVVERAVQNSTCDKLKMLPIAGYAAIVKFVQQWFGIIPKALTNTIQQAENLVCQTTMPDQSSTDAAYLADAIKKDTWECWTKLNGDVVDAAWIGVQTRRTRPTPIQLAQLRRREQLTQKEFDDRIRKVGVINEADKKAIWELTQEWPTASVLTPWLVRDVWDNETIDWKEVDDLFEKKFTKDSEKYFNAIGWTRELAKLHWRAHFHLPSFTMASEMYHRFRNLPENHPLHTDLKKVKALLVQDDWHPAWLERMLAITFRPMRLIDIRNAYDMRVIDDEKLKEKLQVLGYSDDDVSTTFAFWKRRRDLRDAKVGGLPSVDRLIKMYANCEIDSGTMQSILFRIVETDEQGEIALEAAEIARQTEDTRRTIAGVSWQYRRGLIDESEAIEHLSRGGIDPSCIPSLVKVWKARFAKQPKQLTAGTLCTMLERGIITTGEYISALMRAGWTPQDAQRLLASCQIGLTVKEMRRARSEADRLARDQKRLEREAAKAQRLAECGPVPCPSNRRTASQNGAAGP